MSRTNEISLSYIAMYNRSVLFAVNKKHLGSLREHLRVVSCTQSQYFNFNFMKPNKRRKHFFISEKKIHYINVRKNVSADMLYLHKIFLKIFTLLSVCMIRVCCFIFNMPSFFSLLRYPPTSLPH
jgi:hypothetical protein